MQELQSNNSLSSNNLKIIYLKMFVSIYLMQLTGDDDKTTKVTDLPEIFKKYIRHDERKILSFLNNLNEDLSAHGRLTKLINELGVREGNKYEGDDLFKILSSIFDSSKTDSLGHKSLGLNDDELNYVSQVIKNFKDNLGDLLELLNNIQDFTRISVGRIDNKGYHINEVARYPISEGSIIYTWKEIRDNPYSRGNKREDLDKKLEEIINKTEKVKDNLYELIRFIKEKFSELKQILEQFLQMIIARV